MGSESRVRTNDTEEDGKCDENVWNIADMDEQGIEF